MLTGAPDFLPPEPEPGPAAFASLRSRGSWYVRRARSMPPTEFAHRVREAARKRRYRRRPPMVAPPPGRRAALLLPVVERWQDRCPEARTQWAAAAADLVAERLVLLGRPWPFRDGLPLWDADPATGGTWPSVYCHDVDYRHTALGDVKDVWELNRLLHLPPVAAHARLTADTQLAGRLVRQVLDWDRSNPARTGVGWASGIECAMRMVALIAVDELLAGLAPSGFTDVVARMIAEHVDWVRRFPSLHSSANNHRLAELTGELLAGARYPGLVPAPRLVSVHNELAHEAVRQVHDDGISGEQATGYALLALEWLALGRHAAALCGLDDDARLEQRCRAALRALVALSDRSGAVVRIGDDDGSRLLTVLVPEREVLAALTDLVTGAWDVPLRPQGLTTFASGGLTTLREVHEGSEALLVLDHGPLGLGHLAAHAHADTLALWLHLDAEPLLVDAGTFRYHGDGRWRNVLRSTALHNTLTVEDRGSSQPTGPFNWTPARRATGRLLRAQGPPWLLEADHDGYLAPLGVRHRRVVEAVAPLTYRVSDRLDGPGAHACRASFLLAPDCDLEPLDDGWRVLRRGRAVARLVDMSGAGRKQYRGSLDPVRGWCSTAFGKIEPAWQLELAAHLCPGDALTIELRLGGSAAR